ncbi:MAG: hypothetical protein AVDCRST_MAG28-2522, partial [uncultured Rubrobacteraceae bacterium]
DYTRADPYRVYLYFAHFLVRRAEQTKLQRDLYYGSRRGVPEWRVRRMGICLHRRAHLLCVQRTTIVWFHRRWMAFAYWLGCPAPPLWESHRSIRRGFVIRMCRYRSRNSPVVFRRRTICVWLVSQKQTTSIKHRL